MAPLKVVYILGFQRSGSTVLGRVLAGVEGFAFAGELRLLWYVLERSTATCGCGLAHRDCPVWSAVLGRFAMDVADMERLRHEAAPDDGPLRHPSRLRRGVDAAYRDVARQLYRAYAETTNARVIVDGSKDPLYAAFLLGVPDLEVTLVHLVRSPVGVVRSVMRREGRSPRTALVATIRWAECQAASALLRRRTRAPSLRLDYRAFAVDPAATVRAIARAAGESADAERFICDNVARVPTSHTVGDRGTAVAGEIAIAPR